jgi:FkbM family methyltransferase
MKSVVRRVFNKLGLEISRLQKSPYKYLLEVPRYNEIVVDLLGQKFKIADSLSFYWSFEEIFIQNIYKFETYKKCPIILDCGANCGTSIVYFKSIYPNSKITTLEPDPYIFKLLEWNINKRGYSGISLINKAISISNNLITFYCDGADGGRIVPIEDSKDIITVETISLDNLITEPVDFLKMDIEGAETDVICSSEMLENVGQLFIEYHSFKNSNQTLSAILEKLSSHGFRYYIHTQFCSPRPLTEERLQLGMDLQLNIFAKKTVH